MNTCKTTLALFLRHLLFLTCLVSLAGSSAIVSGAPVHWSGRGGPGDLNWSTLSNWNSHLPFDGFTRETAVVFDQYSAFDEARRAPNLDVDLRVGSLTFHGRGFELRSMSGKTLQLPLDITAEGSAALINIAGDNTISHRVSFVDGAVNGRAIFVDSGTLTFSSSGTLDLNGAKGNGATVALTYLTVNDGAALVTNGAVVASSIPGAGTDTRLVKSGGGVWVVGSSGNNLASFSDIRLQGGAIEIAASGALGGKTITNTPGASNTDRQIYINTSGITDTTNYNFTSGAAESSLVIGSLATSGTVVFQGAIKLSQAGTNAAFRNTRFMAAAGVTVVFKGVIGNNSTAADRKGSVEKIGAGTVIFEAANTYTEGTKVTAGTLLFNNATGSGAGTGDVVVGEGATAGGKGAISGRMVTTGTGAVVRPDGGVFKVGSLDVSAGATFRFAPDPADARVEVSGTMTGGSNKIFFDFTGMSGVTPGTTWTLVTFGAAQNIDRTQLVAIGLTGAFSVRPGAIEFLVGGGAALISGSLDSPLFGLKAYADLGIVIDETMRAWETDTAGLTGSAGPDGTQTFAMADTGNLLRIGLGGTPSAGWFTQPSILWCSYSKDSGATWSEPRFVAAAAGPGATLSSLRARRTLNDWEITFTNQTGKTIAVWFREDDTKRMATAGDLLRAPTGKFVRVSLPAAKVKSGEELPAQKIPIGASILVDAAHPPAGYHIDADTGILASDAASVRVLHRAQLTPGTVYQTRITRVPSGDLLVFIPDGYYASTVPEGNISKLFCYRSTDGGQNWSGPVEVCATQSKHYGVLPMIDNRDPGTLHAFETLRDVVVDGVKHEQAYGYYTSGDNGHTWSPPTALKLAGTGSIWNGVGIMPGTQSSLGTWIIGFHHGRILRGALNPGGTMRTWDMVETRDAVDPALMARIDHMDEITVVPAPGSGGEQFHAHFRTNAGLIGEMRGTDDAAAWGSFALTPLVHPDAPPTLATLSDGQTLVSIHHNRAVLRTLHEKQHSTWLQQPMPAVTEIAGRRKMQVSINDWVSRGEIWYALSADAGTTWGEPRLIFANALDETMTAVSGDYVCSYSDVLARDGVFHLAVAHRFQKVILLRIDESDLRAPGKFLTRAQLEAVLN